MSKWLPVAVLFMALVGCVREDALECDARVQLAFRFMKNDGADYFGVEVPSLSVFVFDGNGKFVDRWDDNDNTRFGTDYRMSVPLQPGDYSFVVWGGLKDDRYYLYSPGQPYGETVVLVAGQTTMDEIGIRLTCDTRDAYDSQKHYVDFVPSSLFFGQTMQFTLSGNTDRTIGVDLAKNSKRINLTVIGLPDQVTRANPYPHMDIYADSPNGGYDFRNGLEKGGREFTWVQHGAEPGGPDVQVSVIHSLRMVYGNAHKLTVYNTETGKAVYNADLLEDFIRRVPEYSSQEMVDAEDEFDIIIDLTSPLGVNVTVNGWDVGLSGNVIQ